MSGFDRKKGIEDFTKDWLMITAMITEILFVLKAANIKPPKASLDAIDVIKRAGGTCG